MRNANVHESNRTSERFLESPLSRVTTMRKPKPASIILRSPIAFSFDRFLESQMMRYKLATVTDCKLSVGRIASGDHFTALFRRVRHSFFSHKTCLPALAARIVNS